MDPRLNGQEIISNCSNKTKCGTTCRTCIAIQCNLFSFLFNNFPWVHKRVIKNYFNLILRGTKVQ